MAGLQLTNRMLHGILEITIFGQSTMESADTIAAEVFRLASESQTDKVLIDCRTVQGRMGFGALYHHVHHYPKTRRWTKTAVVDLAEHEAESRFQQTLAANQGLLIECFASVEKAREWLNSK